MKNWGCALFNLFAVHCCYLATDLFFLMFYFFASSDVNGNNAAALLLSLASLATSPVPVNAPPPAIPLPALAPPPILCLSSS
jgi:hypothetical protein